MFTRDSMIARLALLVGIGLCTLGNYASCSFNSGPNVGAPGYGTSSSSTGSGGMASGGPAGNNFQSTLVLRNVSGVETGSFVFGEPIRFDFTVENLSARQMRVSFPDAQTTDYLVVNDGTTQVRWMWSEGQAFAQVSTELVFEPYASKSFSLTWSGTLRDGTNLPVGSYQARGLMVYDGYKTNPLAPSEFASPLQPFTVR
jgi:hypothetical protein